VLDTPRRWHLTATTFLHPDDAATVYSDPELTACLIATPTFSHEAFILGSLQGGKAVFSEKPISQDPSGTVRCYQKWPLHPPPFLRSQAVGKPLFCAFNRRFDPAFSSVRARVQAGEVGHVQMIKVHRPVLPAPPPVTRPPPATRHCPPSTTSRSAEASSTTAPCTTLTWSPGSLASCTARSSPPLTP
jgi:myo-inositol 2-dehydrogenase/D-chiro-inositol 1-dehydrogenase